MERGADDDGVVGRESGGRMIPHTLLILVRACLFRGLCVQSEDCSICVA